MMKYVRLSYQLRYLRSVQTASFELIALKNQSFPEKPFVLHTSWPKLPLIGAQTVTVFHYPLSWMLETVLCLFPAQLRYLNAIIHQPSLKASNIHRITSLIFGITNWKKRVTKRLKNDVVNVAVPQIKSCVLNWHVSPIGTCTLPSHFSDKLFSLFYLNMSCVEASRHNLWWMHEHVMTSDPATKVTINNENAFNVPENSISFSNVCAGKAWKNRHHNNYIL